MNRQRPRRTLRPKAPAKPGNKVWYNGEWVDPVAAAAAVDAKHRGWRTYADEEVPAYCERTEWPARPEGVNNYAGKEPLPERCRAKTLTGADLGKRAPNGAMTGPCYQLDERGPNETQPVLPTLFMPGFPKCASTWLFECMHAAFIPEQVCADPMAGTSSLLSSAQRTLSRGLFGRAAARGRPPVVPFDPKRWNKQGCKRRRFMLPGIACAVTGGCSHRKELFFYGAGYGDYFRVGMAALHGPELPLELFSKEERKPAAIRGRDWDHYRVQRMEQFCTNPRYTHLPPGRMHPSCCIAKASWPKRWGCRWHETLRLRYGKFSTVWFQTAMPWVKPHEYEFASVDFTPNYLCHAGALRNIHATARDPNELRFIVLMRDPIMRAFSEWSMFTTWGWDKDKSFQHRVNGQMNAFRRCNATLYHRPDLLTALPDDELFAYMKKCFRGMAMEYVTNSLYPICIAGALRIFKREQFLFLRFEDLMRMKAPGLLKMLSNFTGLYTDDNIIANVRKQRECEATRAKKVPLSFTQKSNASAAARTARDELRMAIPDLEAFYKPYNQMLQSLVHPAFQWSSDTHRA